MNNHRDLNRKRLFSFSIRTRLIISFLLIIAIPSLTIGLSSYWTAKQHLQEKVQMSAQQNVGMINRYLTNYISPKINDASFFANTFNQVSFSGKNTTNTLTLLQDYKTMHPEVVSTYIGSEKGTFFIYPHADLPAGFDTRTRPWYIQAKAANGQTIITEPYIDAATGNVLITVAKELKDGSGVVGIDLSLSSLKEITGGVKIGNNGFPFILSAKGSYLVHPSQKLGTKATGSWVQPLLAQQNGVITFKENGQNEELDFTTNSLTGLKIVGAVSLDEVNQDSNPILKETLLIIGLCFIIGAAAAYFIVRSVTGKLGRLISATEKVSEGDLTQHFDIQNHDEISILGESFNKMVDSLREVIRNVEEKAELLGASSEQLMASAEQNNLATEQIAHSIQEVAGGTERQTSIVKEGNGVIRKMSAEIEEVRKHAQTVADDSLEAAGIVTNGNDAIQLTTKQMSNIHETVQNLGKVIETLGERSKEINHIIDVISEIAAQTNLLALNAAIEAARAGEHGKGFAVVADEVRKLAEQSSKSTENIRKLISSIQMDTNKAVTSMDKGTTEVAKGIDLVKNAGDAFMQIEQFINRVTKEFQTVSGSIKETANGVEQVVQVVNGIEELTIKSTRESQDVSAVTEEQSASMQEIAASSSSLAKMAEELQDSIRKFKI